MARKAGAKKRGGGRLDRAPVVKGEIRVADRAYPQPGGIAHILDDGGDVIIRAGWRNARGRGENGKKIDIIDELTSSRKEAVLDMPIQIGRKNADPVKGPRLVAFRKTEKARTASRKKAPRDARKGGHEIAPETRVAAEWMILVTSLNRKDFPADGFLCYRHIIDVDPLGEISREDYVVAVGKLLEQLWAANFGAVAACDFEEELPRSGGAKDGRLIR